MARLLARLRIGADSPAAVGLLCIVVALVVALGGDYWSRTRHLDSWMPEGVEYENVKIAAALSRVVYGYPHRYTAHEHVYENLRRGGMTSHKVYLDSLGVKFPDNMSDPALLNRALRDGAEIQPPHPRPPRVVIGDIKPVEPNDLGLVDYYEAAFRLFGLRIQSFYDLYVVLHFVTIALFAVAFWRNAGAMAAMVLIVVLHAFALVFLIGGFTEVSRYGVGAPYNQRFISALGVLSAFHLALTVVQRPRLDWIRLLAFCGQLGIVLLVASCRRSAVWEWLWPALMGAAFVVPVLWVLWRRRAALWINPEELEPRFRRAISWPLVVLALGVGGFQVVSAQRADALYRFSDEWIPQHMVWHSVVLGLTVHPDWHRVHAPKFVDEKGKPVEAGDDLPLKMAEVWLAERYGIERKYLISSVYGHKYRTAESVFKEVFFDFVKRHPRFFLELQLVHKPAMFVRNTVRWNVLTLRAVPWWGAMLLALTLLAAAAGYRQLGRSGSDAPRQIAAILAIGALIAVSPAVIIFPNYLVMSDQAMIMNATVLASLGWWFSRRVARSPGRAS